MTYNWGTGVMGRQNGTKNGGHGRAASAGLRWQLGSPLVCLTWGRHAESKGYQWAHQIRSLWNMMKPEKYNIYTYINIYIYIQYIINKYIYIYNIYIFIYVFERPSCTIRRPWVNQADNQYVLYIYYYYIFIVFILFILFIQGPQAAFGKSSHVDFSKGELSWGCLHDGLSESPLTRQERKSSILRTARHMLKGFWIA